MLLVGFALLLLGPSIHIARSLMGDPDTPTYLVYLAIPGALLVIAAALRSRTKGAYALATLALLLGVAEPLYVANLGLEEYTGPARVGAAMPPFEATLADGTRFDLAALKAKGPALMIFFREW